MSIYIYTYIVVTPCENISNPASHQIFTFFFQQSKLSRLCFCNPSCRGRDRRQLVLFQWCHVIRRAWVGPINYRQCSQAVGVPTTASFPGVSCMCNYHFTLLHLYLDMHYLITCIYQFILICAIWVPSISKIQLSSNIYGSILTCVVPFWYWYI